TSLRSRPQSIRPWQRRQPGRGQVLRLRKIANGSFRKARDWKVQSLGKKSARPCFLDRPVLGTWKSVERRRSPMAAIVDFYAKSLAEVDETDMNPLISLKYPVGDEQRCRATRAGQPLAFYVCDLSQVTLGPMNSGRDLRVWCGLAAARSN